MEEWLLATDQVRQALELTRVPDHTTLYRTFAKLSQAQWQQLNDALLCHLQVNEMTVAVDTTGFRNGTASAYYQSRCGRKRRSWHKGGFAVGTESQLIVGMQVGREPGSDAPWLAPLRAKARRYVARKGRSAQFWLLADAGFDGRDVAWTERLSASATIATRKPSGSRNRSACASDASSATPAASSRLRQ
jgi:hypothetical protein